MAISTAINSAPQLKASAPLKGDKIYEPSQIRLLLFLPFE
jgi:hypothetical protein